VVVVVLVVALLSLLQDFVQWPFLQHGLLSCANAPPEIITAATNNNVSFFILFAILESKDKGNSNNGLIR
jgi:hypothetical protein